VIKLVSKDSVDEEIFRVAESKRGIEKLAVSDLSVQHGDLLLPKMPQVLQVVENPDQASTTSSEESFAKQLWEREQQRLSSGSLTVIE